MIKRLKKSLTGAIHLARKYGKVRNLLYHTKTPNQSKIKKVVLCNNPKKPHFTLPTTIKQIANRIFWHIGTAKTCGGVGIGPDSVYGIHCGVKPWQT